MKPRGYYFGAGPATLPDEILLQAQQDLLNWNGQGVSILEIGHRTEAFMSLMQDTEERVRALLDITSEYAVLFLGGSARLQFGAIPLNVLKPDEKAAFVITGTWSKLAFAEAQKLCGDAAYLIGSSESKSFSDIPERLEPLSPKTRYVYFCPNETIHGVRYQVPSSIEEYLWVADMTSCLFSEPIDIKRYGLIFAGAQKNIANAGMTLVIVRKDWLETPPSRLIPTMLDLKTHYEHQSLYATPPTFNCYLANLMMRWLQKQGGVSAIQTINQQKSRMLYDFLDDSIHYQAMVAPRARSMMNVCFTTGNAKKDAELLIKADEQALYGLKGHKVLGGLRASLYNAMSIEGVEKLIAFLKQSF